MIRKTNYGLKRCADIHTDEDYLEVLRRQRWSCFVVLMLGVVTLVVAGLVQYLDWEVALSSNVVIFYGGVGTGVTTGALVRLIRLHKTMKAPARLRRERVAATDERIVEIKRKAAASADYVLRIAVYLVGLVGGLFVPELLIVLGLLSAVFAVAYAVSCYIYNRIM